MTTQLKIRGSTQILDGTIPAAKFVNNLNLPTAQLADAARFAIKTLSGQLDMESMQIINVGYPVADEDAATKSYVDAFIRPTYRHDFVSPNDYIGRAAYGSSISDAVWLITRTTVAADGSSVQTVAIDVKWDDRLTATYESLDVLSRRTYRHEFVSPHDYIGRATYNALTSDSVWLITRTTVAPDGSTVQTVATNVKWDDRLTATYV